MATQPNLLVDTTLDFTRVNSDPISILWSEAVSTQPIAAITDQAMLTRSAIHSTDTQEASTLITWGEDKYNLETRVIDRELYVKYDDIPAIVTNRVLRQKSLSSVWMQVGQSELSTGANFLYADDWIMSFVDQIARATESESVNSIRIGENVINEKSLIRYDVSFTGGVPSSLRNSMSDLENVFPLGEAANVISLQEPVSLFLDSSGMIARAQIGVDIQNPLTNSVSSVTVVTDIGVNGSTNPAVVPIGNDLSALSFLASVLGLPIELPANSVTIESEEEGIASAIQARSIPSFFDLILPGQVYLVDLRPDNAPVIKTLEGLDVQENGSDVQVNSEEQSWSQQKDESIRQLIAQMQQQVNSSIIEETAQYDAEICNSAGYLKDIYRDLLDAIGDNDRVNCLLSEDQSRWVVWAPLYENPFGEQKAYYCADKDSLETITETPDDYSCSEDEQEASASLEWINLETS